MIALSENNTFVTPSFSAQNGTTGSLPNKLEKPKLHQLWLNLIKYPNAAISSNDFRLKDYKIRKSRFLKCDAEPNITERTINDIEMVKKQNTSIASVSPSNMVTKQETSIVSLNDLKSAPHRKTLCGMSRSDKIQKRRILKCDTVANITKRSINDIEMVTKQNTSIASVTPSNMVTKLDTSIVSLNDLKSAPHRKNLCGVSRSDKIQKSRVLKCDAVANITKRNINDIEMVTKLNTRIVLLNDFKTVPHRKKLCGMSRSDFVSEKAWIRYRANHLKLKTQLYAERKKMSRKKLDMEKIISELKLKNDEKNSQFFKGLPETLKAIVCRIDRSNTDEYSEELKTFAMGVHSLSQPAYYFIRSRFNNLLPHSKTVASWRSVLKVCTTDTQMKVIEAVAAGEIGPDHGCPIYSIP